MLKIDLGSGGCKQEGFLAVDRFPLENVDVVADLDERLPFKSDSVDLVYASHSLEHVRDLIATMREVYRICKHGAQICIVAPYNEQKLNFANPYHVCVFNEHTPRFWTDYPEAPIDPAEYAHPHARHWGLSRSDHSNPGLDLRLVRIEFFYFPGYRNLTVAQQRSLRSERLDVCDQIMYHLIVWKGDKYSPGRTFADHVAAFQPFEPDYVRKRKATEQNEMLQVICRERDQARLQIVELQNQLAQKEKILVSASNNTRRLSELEADIDRSERRLADMRKENHQLRMQLAGVFEKNETLNDQLQATKVVLVKSQVETKLLSERASGLSQENLVLKNQVVSLSENQHSAQNDVVKLSSTISLLKVDLEASNGLLTWYRSQEAFWNTEAFRMKAELGDADQLKSRWEEGKGIVRQLYAQVGACRSSRMAHLASFLTSKDMLWDLVSPAFAEIKSYTAQHFKKSSGIRFILGDDLSSVPYREYTIPFNMDGLNKVSLAIRPLLPSSRGMIGVEIVSASQRVVCQVSMPLLNIDPDRPSEFIMPTPLSNLGDAWSLRVFVRDVEVPVAIYELVKCSVFSRRVNFLPFVFFSKLN